MSKTILFSFGHKRARGGAKGIADAERAFKRAGADVVTREVDEKTKRTSGVSYRRIFFTFADSQQIELWVKLTGDIFKVKLGSAGRFKKEIPIREQDNHSKAIAEMVKAMDSRRKAFQKKMAKTKIETPKSIRTPKPKMEVFLKDKDSALDEAIAASEEELESIKASYPVEDPVVSTPKEKPTSNDKVGLTEHEDGTFTVRLKAGLKGRKYKTRRGADNFMKRSGIDADGNAATLDSTETTIEPKFEDGDVVALHGNDKKMTVKATVDGVVECEWFVEADLHKDNFEADDLTTTLDGVSKINTFASAIAEDMAGMKQDIEDLKQATSEKE